jgi:hypothetical protein
MFEPTRFTWILIIFGIITFAPLFYAQLIIIINPQGQKAKDILIGKGEEWRDESHFKSAYALARTDWIFLLPIFIAAVVGVIIGELWGYVLFGISAAISVYINIFLWFYERKYVYPAVGAFAYYTYIWGNIIYWEIPTFEY